jgi:type II secretory pathway predicted ATPase ExeA
MNTPPTKRPTIPGSQFVPTDAYEEALLKAHEMVHRYGILQVTGPPGVGKTKTCQQIMGDLAADYGMQGIWVQLGEKPTSKEVLSQLLRALGMRPKRGEPAWSLAFELGDLLAAAPRTVWIDEAQHLGASAFTTIRTIHDRPDARWMLGIVGTHDLHKKLAKDQPELASRVGRRVKMRRIDDDRTLLTILNTWHPLLAACEDHRLLRMNRIGPKGDFRDWADVLETVVRISSVEGGFTERVEAQALHQCGYTLPAELSRWL